MSISNPDLEEVSQISKLISDVFVRMEPMAINTNVIWEKIDEAVVLCLISACGDLVKGIRAKCPEMLGSSRCFQLLGFDVLLDPALNPWVLEVNYRPSLKSHRAAER
jgi:hypothetical protein